MPTASPKDGYSSTKTSIELTDMTDNETSLEFLKELQGALAELGAPLDILSSAPAVKTEGGRMVLHLSRRLYEFIEYPPNLDRLKPLIRKYQERLRCGRELSYKIIRDDYTDQPRGRSHS